MAVAFGMFRHFCKQHTVHEYEFENRYHIWVCNKHGGNKRGFPSHGFGITLKRKWWHTSSPAERIRNYRIKAEKYAAKLNHEDMYIQHEKEVAKR